MWQINVIPKVVNITEYFMIQSGRNQQNWDDDTELPGESMFCVYCNKTKVIYLNLN